MQALDVTTLRELEDLIIDAIYRKLVFGKLDQKNRQFTIGKLPATESCLLLSSRSPSFSSCVIDAVHTMRPCSVHAGRSTDQRLSLSLSLSSPPRLVLVLLLFFFFFGGGSRLFVRQGHRSGSQGG